MRRSGTESNSLNRREARFRRGLAFLVLMCVCVWGVGGLAARSSVRADLVYFAKGAEAQVPVTTDGASIRIDIPGRSFEFLKDDFRAIVPGHWPEREWKAREAVALAGGAEARATAAWWALENGLTPQAESMLKSAHQADPGHQPTARMVAVLARLAKPCPDPDLEPLLRALGGASEVARGPHVVLVHQHTAEEAAERVDLLERVVTTYYLLFAAQGIDLALPDHRLASAYFSEHKDYLAYLRAENLETFRLTRGYFHPTLNAVLAYDARSSGALKQSGEPLATRQRELAAWKSTLERLPSGRRLQIQLRGESPRTMSRGQAQKYLEELQRDLSRQQLLLELDRRSIDLGTAAHEMVHQLVASSRLAPHHDDFPLWLHEGFAAQFEVIRGGRWAGVGRAHDLRLPDWRVIPRRTSLPLLLEDHGFGRGYQRDSYAQAWALVFYLRKERPQQFLTFLDLLRAPDTRASRSKNRSASAFRLAFGDDLEKLQNDWHAFLDGLKTPLEESRKDATSLIPKPGISKPN
ncbi:Protein of unknown function (DUF1570) [Singulisphaera acidiphila DSM 18658]|uniref:DUF1570 domain-containing protein n=1 Tax=Singulisphaera acidiphila (strain ATCC BAA-1392 / DSM 18658 / VKM B-2454 / MOB10) TaxID=886293 RepID=L0DBY0_SINAD|nr:Protein of unknown function (DUF1570) [Singulisphaera acidiphila DSM 18658]